MTVFGVRLYALGLSFCCVNNVFKSMYQGTEKVLLTEISSVAEGVLLPSLCAWACN